MLFLCYRMPIYYQYPLKFVLPVKFGGRALVASVLAVASSCALAQSAVTIYGKLDAAVGRQIGTTGVQVFDTGGGTSRIGFRGVEDLGGGLKATFGLEQRFHPDTGSGASSRLWHGFSTVGLTGNFGSINLGRQYTPVFLLVQNQVDPFGAETVATLRGVGMFAGVALVRMNNSISYDYRSRGLWFSVAIADRDDNGAAQERPWSVAGSYTAGPLYVGVGYENAPGTKDKLWNLAARYTLGGATLSAGVAIGDNNNGDRARGFLVGVTYEMGSGTIKAGFGQTEIGNTKTAQRYGIGYHYALSKRTKLFADIAQDRKATIGKTGVDLGIQHVF